VGLFERAIRLAPGQRAMLARLAAAQIAEGRPEAAVGLLEDELTRQPDWVEAHAVLARVRWERGEHEHFTASFERAVQAAPNDLALWRGYVDILLRDQLHERALAVIARARSAVGSHPAFDAAEAVARSELGEAEAAADLFARVAHLSSVSVVVAQLRLLIRSGRIREAAAIAERHLPQGGNWIWPYLSIVWRLLGDSRWEWLEGEPRFIGVYDIADTLPELGALAERLRTIHRTTHSPLDQSLRGGTQTDGDLLTRLEPEIRQLRRALVAAVERHVAQLPPPRPGHPRLVERRAPILFSGSWSVRLQAGGRHVEHFHPAGWISSALYVALPAEAERGAGEAGWLGLGEARELGVDLPPIRLVEPKPGRLVLFPSTMWHGTRPFADGERLTVAFDVRRPG
jgi:tetratricopeptide (TPR) repeat protein